MMRVLVALALSLCALSAVHAGAPKKLWELKGFDAPESVVFDPASNALYVSNIGGKIWQKDRNSFLAKVSADGKMIERDWLTGLDSPTGLALDGGKLYVADIDQLVEIDIASKSIAKRYPAPGVKWFNDVASDGKGVVYVADSATNTIWRLKDGKFEAWLTDEALNAPNGLYVEGDTLLVAPFGAMAEKGKDAKLATLLKVSLSDRSIKRLGTGLALGNLDGVKPIEPGVYLVTDWASGPLYRVDAQGNVVRLLDLRQGTADVNFLPETKTILIPLMLDNALVAYKLE
jgi:DNA-binding beta-propeller fold protein YncE